MPGTPSPGASPKAEEALQAQPSSPAEAPAEDQRPAEAPAEGDAKEGGEGDGKEREEKRELERSRERRRRSRSRDRGDRRRRSRSRSRDRRRRRSRSRDKRRSRSRSRDRRRSSRRSRSHDRRRSRSRSHEKVVVERAPVYEIERVKPEDRAPVAPLMPTMPIMPTMGGLPGLSTLPNLPNLPVNPLMPNLMPNLAAAQARPQVGQLNQMTRPARRLYVGSLPTPCYDFMLTTFLNQALMALGICSHGKTPIINCQVTPERNFAFIEFADTADATAALQLDGIPFRGSTLKIKRPKDYMPLFGAPPDPTPLGPTIMAQLLSSNAPEGAAAGAPALPAVPGGVALPPGGLPLPGAGIPGAAAALAGMAPAVPGAAPPLPGAPPLPQ
ncbi:hypothetical protein ABPG75_005611 [Micractinium tetrahymenae]